MLAIAGLALSTFIAAAAPVKSHLVIAPCEAGDHYQFETVTCSIELKNTGDKPIRISKGEAKLPWDSIDTKDIVVPPGATRYIDARVDLRDNLGITRRYFRFATDEPGQEYRGSHVRAFVSTVLDQPALNFEFGTVRLGSELPSASVTLSSREAPDFRVLEVIEKPPYLDVSIAPDGRTVNARILDTAPWGLMHTDKVKLKTNATRQPQAWVTVKADVLGDVLVNGNPFALGLMRTGNKNEFLIRLTSKNGKDFKVGDLSITGLKANADTTDCTPAAKGCKLVRLVVPDQPVGRLEGVLHIGLPEYNRSLPVELVGMMLTPNYPVHDLDEEMKKAAEETQGGQSPAQAPAEHADLSKALKQVVEKTNATPPPGNGPLLRWSVANQSPLYGYIVYRAESEKGPFLRLNQDLIKIIADEENKSGSYQWRDNSAVSGKTYWYTVGTVKRDGTKQELTPVQKVVAK